MALEAYPNRGHTTDASSWEDLAQRILAAVDGTAGIQCEAVHMFHGRPRAVLHVNAGGPKRARRLVQSSEASSDRICVSDDGVLEGFFVINPFSLHEGETVVAARLLEAADGLVAS